MHQTVSKISTIDQIDLRTLRLFICVGQSGSFSDAARMFDLTRTVVSRLIAQLEGQLGVRLFQRTTRKVGLTEAGDALLAQLTGTLDEVRFALAKAQAKTDILGGKVTVSVAHAFGRYFVLPALARFAQDYPDIQVELRMAEGIDDLVDTPIDLVIRQGGLPDSSIVARRLGQVGVVLAATKLMLKERRIAAIEDLRNLPLLGFRIPGSGAMYRWVLSKGGEQFVYTPDGYIITTDSVEAVADMIKSGYGIGAVPYYLVEAAISEGSIMCALTDYTLAGVPIHLCYGSKELMPKRVRILADYLIAALSPRLK